MGSALFFAWEKYTKTTLGPFQSTPYNIWWVKKRKGAMPPIPLSAVSVVVYLYERVTLDEFNGSVVNGDCTAALCEHGVHTTL